MSKQQCLTSCLARPGSSTSVLLVAPSSTPRVATGRAWVASAKQILCCSSHPRNASFRSVFRLRRFPSNLAAQQHARKTPPKARSFTRIGATIDILCFRTSSGSALSDSLPALIRRSRHARCWPALVALLPFFVHNFTQCTDVDNYSTCSRRRHEPASNSSRGCTQQRRVKFNVHNYLLMSSSLLLSRNRFQFPIEIRFRHIFISVSSQIAMSASSSNHTSIYMSIYMSIHTKISICTSTTSISPPTSVSSPTSIPISIYINISISSYMCILCDPSFCACMCQFCFFLHFLFISCNYTRF